MTSDFFLFFFCCFFTIVVDSLSPRSRAPDNVTENSQDKYTDIMLKTLNTQFNAYGIEITDLQIQDVRLPLDTQHTVEAKTTIGTSRKLEEMRQNYKMKEIVRRRCFFFLFELRCVQL